MTIERFSGPHDYLSNFHPCSVEMDGFLYPTVEHAFQAAKSLDPYVREEIRLADTAAKAKRLGRTVMLRADWEEVKIEIMYDLLVKKFSIPFFQKLLLATGDRELIEGNTWGDTFWGVYRTRGENHLGKLLMQIREEMRA